MLRTIFTSVTVAAALIFCAASFTQASGAGVARASHYSEHVLACGGGVMIGGGC